MAIHSAWLELTGQSGVDTRQATSVAMVPTGPVTSRSGVVPDGGFGLQQVSAMQCQIMPGRAYVQGLTLQGGFQVASDAPVVLTVPNGDATYNRVDLVVLQIQDQQFDGSGQSQAVVVLIPGTPAATPAPPAPPPAALALFQIAVPSKASTTSGVPWSTAVTDVRAYTSGLGGIVPAGTTAWTPPMVGQYSDLNGELQRWNGASWTPVYDPTANGGTLPQFTSTTRPANAPAGKLVYETDTGAVSLYSGGTWYPQPGAIASQTLTASASSVTFTNIPQIYRDLRLRICAKSDGNTNTGYDTAGLRFNYDAGSNYSWNSYGAAQAATALAVVNSNISTSMQCAQIWNSYYPNAGRGLAMIDIPNYSDTNNVKVFSGLSTATDGGSAGFLQTYGGGWHLTTYAVSTITISMNVGNFIAGSTFTLYALG